MWASPMEQDERFLDETLEKHLPADPGDVRFELGMAEDGMEETPFWLKMIDDTGTVVERHWFATSGERYSLIDAHRDAQARRAEADRLGLHPLAIEFAPYGEAWVREQEERFGVRS